MYFIWLYYFEGIYFNKLGGPAFLNMVCLSSRLLFLQANHFVLYQTCSAPIPELGLWRYVGYMLELSGYDIVRWQLQRLEVEYEEF